MTSLWERVAQAETAALRQAEDLRAQLAAVEERLQRLAITRETLTEFAGAHSGDTGMTEGDGAVAEEEPSDVAHLTPEAEPPQLPPLWGFRQQVVALLFSSDAVVSWAFEDLAGGRTHLPSCWPTCR